MRSGIFDLAIRQLLKAIGDTPLISVSQKPMSLGQNICVGDIGRKFINIWKQQLIGCRNAKTPYVALAEDDILFPPEHFEYRPSTMDTIAYEMNKYGIYPWLQPAAFVKLSGRLTIGAIAPRQLIVDALEERFAMWPNDDAIPLQHWGEVGRARKESALGVTVRASEVFESREPSVVFYHSESFGHDFLGERKRVGHDRVASLEMWGNAADLYGFARAAC